MEKRIVLRLLIEEQIPHTPRRIVEAENKLFESVRSKLQDLGSGFPLELRELSLGIDMEFAIRRMDRIQDAIQGSLRGKQSEVLIVKDIMKVMIADTIEDDKNLLNELEFYGEYLTSRVKMEVILHFYNRSYGANALKVLVDKYKLYHLECKDNAESQTIYVVKDSEIHDIYSSENFILTHDDMLDVLTALVFRQYKKQVLNEKVGIA